VGVALVVVVVSVLVVFVVAVLPFAAWLVALPVLLFAVGFVELPVLVFWAFMDKTPINANPRISALFLAIPGIFLNLIIIIFPFYCFKDKECLNCRIQSKQRFPGQSFTFNFPRKSC
jgi:hypothetical protein